MNVNVFQTRSYQIQPDGDKKTVFLGRRKSNSRDVRVTFRTEIHSAQLLSLRLPVTVRKAESTLGRLQYIRSRSPSRRGPNEGAFEKADDPIERRNKAGRLRKKKYHAFGSCTRE